MCINGPAYTNTQLTKIDQNIKKRPDHNIPFGVTQYDHDNL